MNPNSNFHLSINFGFPNSFDKANKRNGSFLMIHGDCLSAGCYAMTDEQISEIYSLARDSLSGRPSFQVQAYPFRLTPANLARHRNSPNLAFWRMLKVGNDHFETTQREPKVDVCNRRYVFDAQPPPNSPQPLVFNANEKCPPFVVNPEIARRALEKQRADERAYAQLLEDNVPAAPIYSGLDGGMNKAFLARFPYRVTLAKVMPYASYLPQLPPIPWIDNDGSLTSKWFGTSFSKLVCVMRPVPASHRAGAKHLSGASDGSSTDHARHRRSFCSLSDSNARRRRATILRDGDRAPALLRGSAEARDRRLGSDGDVLGVILR
jgi:hypothetical protein